MKSWKGTWHVASGWSWKVDQNWKFPENLKSDTRGSGLEPSKTGSSEYVGSRRCGRTSVEITRAETTNATLYNCFKITPNRPSLQNSYFAVEAASDHWKVALIKSRTHSYFANCLHFLLLLFSSSSSSQYVCKLTATYPLTSSFFPPQHVGTCLVILCYVPLQLHPDSRTHQSRMVFYFLSPPPPASRGLLTLFSRAVSHKISHFVWSMYFSLVVFRWFSVDSAADFFPSLVDSAGCQIPKPDSRDEILTFQICPIKYIRISPRPSASIQFPFRNNAPDIQLWSFCCFHMVYSSLSSLFSFFPHSLFSNEIEIPAQSLLTLDVRLPKNKTSGAIEPLAGFPSEISRLSASCSIWFFRVFMLIGVPPNRENTHFSSRSVPEKHMPHSSFGFSFCSFALIVKSSNTD